MKVSALRNTLKGNVLFSIVSGTTLLVANQWLSGLMGVAKPVVLMIIGGGLLLFGGYVWFQSSRPHLVKKEIWGIIIADWGWVAGSIALVLSQAFGLTSTGYIIILVVAAIVGLLATLQMRFVK